MNISLHTAINAMHCFLSMTSVKKVINKHDIIYVKSSKVGEDSDSTKVSICKNTEWHHQS